MKRLVCLALTVLMILLSSGCDDGRPPNEVHSPDDLAGRVIGALSGSPSARLAGDYGVAHAFTAADEMMSHLRAGSVDCVIMERVSAEEAIESHSGVRILGEPLLEYDVRFAVAKENNQLLTAVNSALAALTENGTLGGIRGKYFAGRNYNYASAADAPDGTRELTLAVSPDAAPFSYINEDGMFAGFYIEVALAVCDFLGIGLRVVGDDVAELIPAVQLGRVDLALGWLPDDLGGLVDVSDSCADIAHVVVVRR